MAAALEAVTAAAADLAEEAAEAPAAALAAEVEALAEAELAADGSLLLSNLASNLEGLLNLMSNSKNKPNLGATSIKRDFNLSLSVK